MALASSYQTFRTTANPAGLCKDVALHYVPTLLTHKEPTTITKHLTAQAKELSKKEEVLSSVETATALVQEVQTILEFLTGGGAYLPGLEENLIADQTATIVILHVVHFDANGNIAQIRQHWDQAALLKAVGVIGARGANWPITEGTSQAKLVRASAAGEAPGTPAANTLEETTKQMAGVTITSRPTKKVNPTNDPHTSLDFAAPAGDNATHGTPPPAAMATRGTARPQDRAWGDLFAGGGSSEATPVARKGAESPSKGSVASKIGAGKNYSRNRLFEDDEQPAETPSKFGGGKNYARNRLFEDDEQPTESPSKAYIKPNAGKYSHFDFYDGHDEPIPQASAPKPHTKHQSQIDFEDFAKPVRTRGQSQGAHHFSFDDDTKNDSPMKKQPQQHKPRRDAASQYEMQDDGGDVEAVAASRPGPRGGHGGHYRNQSTLWESQTDDGGPDEATAKSYTASTVTSQKDRSKDFGAHWQMDDEHPGATDEADDISHRPTGLGANAAGRSKDFAAHWQMDDEHPGATDEQHDASHPRAGVSANRAKALQTLAPQWEARDDSPAATEGAGGAPGKENAPAAARAGGDVKEGWKAKGPGRHWGFGDDGDYEAEAKPVYGKGRQAPGGQASVGFWEGLEGK